MTDDSTPPEAEANSRRTVRKQQVLLRLSKSEKERLEADARATGFGTLSDYIRDRLFHPTRADHGEHQRIDGGLLNERQWGELAIATIHLYRIHEKAYEQAGDLNGFALDRRQVIDELGLGKLVGTGAK